MLSAIYHVFTDANPLAHLWWWVEIHTGATNESGAYYGWWSGFASDLGEITLLGGAWLLYRKHNCATPGCWRIGKHPTADGTFILCKHHHPDLMGKKFSLEEIHAHHHAAKARLCDPPTVSYRPTITIQGHEPTE